MSDSAIHPHPRVLGRRRRSSRIRRAVAAATAAIFLALFGTIYTAVESQHVASSTTHVAATSTSGSATGSASATSTSSGTGSSSSTPSTVTTSQS